MYCRGSPDFLRETSSPSLGIRAAGKGEALYVFSLLYGISAISDTASRASDINEEMKIAAAHALASLVSDEELNEDYILPKAMDSRVREAVSSAVAKAARESGVARI